VKSKDLVKLKHSFTYEKPEFKEIDLLNEEDVVKGFGSEPAPPGEQGMVPGGMAPGDLPDGGAGIPAG